MIKNKLFQNLKNNALVLALFLVLFGVVSAQVLATNWLTVRSEQAGTCRGVIWANNQYVAVGDAGLVMTSPDGKAWTKRTSGSTRNFYAVTYGNGLYVAVGYHGIVYTSPNGTTWTERIPFTTDGVSFTSIAYNGTDLFVAGGVGRVAISPDGITWTPVAAGISNQLSGMYYANGKFIAAASGPNAFSSTNGVSWTRLTLPGADPYLNNISICYGNGLWVLGGGKGQIFTSPNGTTWTKRNSGQINHVMALTWTGQHYVGCGDANNVGCSMVMASEDGITWVRDRTDKYRGLLGTASNGTHVVCVGIKELIVWNTVGGVGDGNGCANTPPPPVGPTITITSPTSTTKWAPGATQNITWRSSKKYDHVDIEYYNGKSWSVVVSGTADDGSHPWVVPNTPTTSARIWMKGFETAGNAADYSDYFTISGTAPTENSINITYPNGGETLPAGGQQNITWRTTGNINTVDIEYTLDGTKWTPMVTGTANDGSYIWTVPTTMSTKCKIWMKGWGTNGNDTDYTDATFSIGASIIITAPNGGENWSAGSTQNITWNTVGTVGNVKVDYSLNMGNSWANIVPSTPNDGSLPWTLPATQSSQCLVRLSEISGGKVSDTSNAVFTIGGEPSLVVDKSALTFSAVQAHADQGIQTINITNGGGGTLNWNASSNAAWLTIAPSSGTGNGPLAVYANPSGLDIGTYTGTITITDTKATNSPLNITVTFHVLGSGQDMAPFGTLATPINGSTGVSGSVAITGWALDDIEVASVKIYRQVNGELSYIGDATFVEGSRPDVEVSYPDYPYNYRAGWGYMMLTNFVPDGQLILTAIAADNTGHEFELGTTTITLDNTHAVKPFGAIDSPSQGGTIAGKPYRNNGWALTPMPNKIPTNGSTINVYIDGVAIGKATYNLYRSDIAQLFPGYANSNNSWGYFDIDTTAYSNGLHTIQWSVTDNAGNSDGVGSRYFKIMNTSARSAAATSQSQPNTIGLSHHQLKANLTPSKTSPNAVSIKTGYSDSGPDSEVTPDSQGVLDVQMNETGRIQIALTPSTTTARNCTGYMVVNGQRRPLPVGSSLDAQNGVFYWQAGPGFVGRYDLVFDISENGKTSKKEIHVTILPGSTK